MNILLNIGNTDGPVLNNFSYVINRNPNNGQTSIEKVDQNGNYTTIGNVSYVVNRKTIVFRFLGI